MTTYNLGAGRLYVGGMEYRVSDFEISTLAAEATLNRAPGEPDLFDGGYVGISVEGDWIDDVSYGGCSWDWRADLDAAASIRPDPLPPPSGRAALLASASIRPADVPAGPRDGWYGATDVFDRFALRQVARNVGKTALAERIERERRAAGRRSDFLPVPICPA